ncbi:hypothetical protein HDR63_03210 [bacterium]|nr:hypothetical protein [bacterium]
MTDKVSKFQMGGASLRKPGATRYQQQLGNAVNLLQRFQAAGLNLTREQMEGFAAANVGLEK